MKIFHTVHISPPPGRVVGEDKGAAQGGGRSQLCLAQQAVGVAVAKLPLVEVQMILHLVLRLQTGPDTPGIII